MFVFFMMIKFLILKFCFCFSYFWYFCNVGRYFLIYRVENLFVKICICFYFVWNLLEFLNLLGVEYGLCCSNKMWLGVKGFKLLGLFDIRGIGLLFRIFFIFIRNVIKVFLLIRCLLIIVWRIF